jgi:hypothetical protein
MRQRVIVVIISIMLLTLFANVDIKRGNNESNDDSLGSLIEFDDSEELSEDEEGEYDAQEEHSTNENQSQTETSATNERDNKSLNQTETHPTEEHIPELKILTVSPIDLEKIDAIVPLGAMNPPSHVFPTDHIYFYITRSPGADGPHTATLYSPGNLTITRIRASEHINAGITDYSINMESELRPGSTIVFGHASSINQTLLGDVSDDSGWTLEAEYSTGGETYRAWRKELDVEVQAGDILGTAGGNPGQWALDLGIYDKNHHPDKVANMDRWSYSWYLNAVDPLGYYKDSSVLDSLYGLVYGDYANTSYNLVLQDEPGTAQGCWFTEGTTNTYPEDPHLALVRSNIDLDTRVFSVGTSVQGLDSGKYEFIPHELGLINCDFSDLTPDGVIYGYRVQGNQGTIIVQMMGNSTLWVEALSEFVEPENWIFTEYSIFER